MSFGYHVQNSFNLNRLPEFTARLCQIYETAGEHFEDSSKEAQRKWHRLYVGDEFCVHRLPDLSCLEELFTFSRKIDLPVTLLTPMVSDFGIDKCKVLFDYLSENAPDTEIVVNDWGMVYFLRENFPKLSLSLGRLLNKGFKDPRVTHDQIAANASESMFNSSTFDFEAFRKQARTCGANRLERDLLPYGGDIMSEKEDMATSIYFPYGYVTTGRVCRTAALTAQENERFAINNRCTQMCKNVAFEMKHPDYTFQMFQSGNTVFYLYPQSACQSLLEKEKSDNVRLIFQDFNMKTEASI